MERVLAAVQIGGGLLWKTFWALAFGHLISAGLQVLVIRAPTAREHAERQRRAEGGAQREGAVTGRGNWRDKLTSLAGWQAIADAFFMEWKMGYKEILFGFTVGDFISVFVPDSSPSSARTWWRRP